ncbi:DnaJ domain-containing protein [Umboniibacter marinipuniceus]|uniref:DnaJ-like protein n=1 Tax=Umboniibacter marinipuniceus TaxID=569599 RepID=A0A3M0AI19_9GAMM|nr:DnaJ domain-containing protein [Umboniibacter marinipuniceus]RMA78862.1 DnaJ-like protein [Umboniibacter marinipuniceus]
MPAIIILVFLAFVGYFLRASYYKQPVDTRTRWLTVRVLWALVGLCVIAAATGRLHVMGALTSPLIPIAWQLYTRFNPLNKATDDSKQRSQASTSTMTRSQALKILGLNDGATPEEIKSAHRELMAKYHPDRGGNEFLAAQINEARDQLLG